MMASLKHQGSLIFFSVICESFNSEWNTEYEKQLKWINIMCCFMLWEKKTDSEPG